MWATESGTETTISKRDNENTDYESEESHPTPDEEYAWSLPYVPDELMHQLHQWYDAGYFESPATDVEISLDHASEEEWEDLIKKLSKE